MSVKHTILPSLAFFALLIFASCRKDNVNTPPPTYATFAEELLASPDSIALGTNYLKMEAYVYRNFMPVSEDPQGPLIAVNHLKDINFSAIDTSVVQMIKQHLIVGDSVWTLNYEDLYQNQPWQVDGVVRTGPLLEPGTNVDVVCEFKMNGVTYRLRRLAMTVNAVY